MRPGLFPRRGANLPIASRPAGPARGVRARLVSATFSGSSEQRDREQRLLYVAAIRRMGRRYGRAAYEGEAFVILGGTGFSHPLILAVGLETIGSVVSAADREIALLILGRQAEFHSGSIHTKICPVVPCIGPIASERVQRGRGAHPFSPCAPPPRTIASRGGWNGSRTPTVLSPPLVAMERLCKKRVPLLSREHEMASLHHRLFATPLFAMPAREKNRTCWIPPGACIRMGVHVRGGSESGSGPGARPPRHA